MAYRKVLILAVLLIATALALYLSFRLLYPFLPALTVATTVAILLRPFYLRLEKRFEGWPNLTAGILVALVAAAVLAPIFLIGNRLVEEAEYASVKLQQIDWQQIGPARWLRDYLNLNADLERLLQTAQEWIGTVLRVTVGALTQSAIALFALFFFLRDYLKMAEVLRSLTPLSGTETDHLFERVISIVRATILGNFAVAGIQGLLGGLMYWIVGLQAPVLWGVVTAIMAVIPVFGAFFVWAPASLLLFLQGDWGRGAILAGAGVLISSIDNVLYPMLVGRENQLHTLPVFLAFLGGIVVFGTSGLILGPVILTVTIGLLQIVKKKSERPFPVAPRPAR